MDEDSDEEMKYKAFGNDSNFNLSNKSNNFAKDVPN